MNQTLVLKATGETATISRSTADTNGAFVEFITTLPAGRHGPPLHIHPKQTEYFEAIEGRLGIALDNKRVVLDPGQSFELPEDTLHTFYNAGNTAMKFKVIFKPALSMEWFANEMIAAANRSYPKRPSIFETAYILSQVKGEYHLEDLSMFKQKILFPVLALIGKWFGLIGKVRAKGRS
jgi:mannose-6-phosphate isomerase-like protein (cupin superfamily)